MEVNEDSLELICWGVYSPTINHIQTKPVIFALDVSNFFPSVKQDLSIPALTTPGEASTTAVTCQCNNGVADDRCTKNVTDPQK